MGLDTTAYEFVERLRGGGGSGDDDRHILAFSHKNFPHALEGLEGVDSFFVFPGGREVYRGGFHYRGYGNTNHTCSSYSGHSYLRDLIADKFLDTTPEEIWVNPDEFKDKPFFELINFSDCEGVLGPVACRNLADDFNSHPDLDSGDSFYDELYKDFGKSFNIAADTGVVVFH